MSKVIDNTVKNNKMVNNLNGNEARSLAKYIRTHGEYRSGLTTTVDNGTLVPSQIINTVQNLSKNKFQLKPLLNQVFVKSSKGDYPILSSDASAVPKDELAKYPDLDNGVTTVPFKIGTYAGRLQISNELLEDANFPIMPILTQQMSIIQTNTENKIISSSLSQLNAHNVSSLNDVIDAISNMDPRWSKLVLCGSNAYSKLLSMQDANKDYYFFNVLNGNTPNIMGLKLIKLPAYIGNPDDIFIGDPSVALTWFNRLETELTYNNNNLFGTSLAMIIRGDCEITNSKALTRLTLGGSSSNGSSK